MTSALFDHIIISGLTIVSHKLHSSISYIPVSTKNQATIDLRTKRHPDSVSMTGRKWPVMECWLGCDYRSFFSDDAGSFPKGEVMSALESEFKMSINYFHSFGMTENYYVYIEQPMYINILKILAKKLSGSAVDTAIEFYDNINVGLRGCFLFVA